MSSILSLNVLDLILGFSGVYLLYRLVSSRLTGERLPLPPGPTRLPLIGNLLDLPKGLEGPHWAKHKALYGPISSIEVFGSTMIIVNDKNIAIDLLDKRSQIYSSRPVLTFGGELVGLDKVTTFLPYGDTFRQHRKWFQSYIGTRSALQRFEEHEETETRRFLLRILDDPERFMDHLRTLPGAIILRMSNGYNVSPGGSDPFIKLADEAVGTIFSEACQPGTWLVDVAPILKYMPEWMPGAGFKKTARVWAKTISEFYDKPHAFVKHQMAAGKAKPSFVSNMLGSNDFTEHQEDILKYTASTIYGGGADTTVSSLGTFFLAMARYPAVFRRAQEEIDLVIGSDRLPSFRDRENLPYINALCKEIFRWENVVPAGVPHVTTEDDNYKGYYIPKGALVFPIIWQMTHDPDYYPDPFVFKPERFLEQNGHMSEPDPRSIAFGFGRRICPGKELGESTVFITVAMTAAVFNITKVRDKYGGEIEPVNEFTPGLISHPKPFRCSISPRSEKSAAMIRSVLDDYPFEKGDGDILRAL